MEWLRKHKKIVMVFGLLAMVGTAFWGVLHTMTAAGQGPGRGPYGYISDLEGARRYVSPEEVFQERLIRTQLDGYGIVNRTQKPYSSHLALREMAQCQLVRDLGFDEGRKELDQRIRGDIIRRTQKESVTEERYKLLLDNLQLLRPQYERLIREYSTVLKYQLALVNQADVTGGVVYVNYCEQKQRARLFYKEFKSRDYEDLAGNPSPEDVNKYYGMHQKPNERPLDSLFTDPALSVDVLYMPVAQVARLIEPTEAELRKFYDKNKNQFSKPTVAGQPPPTGDAAYKTFEEAQAEVLKLYKEDQVLEKVTAEMKRIGEELQAALDKLEKEQKDKPEAEKRKFDWAAFAQARGLTHWRTKKLTEKEFRKGANKPKAEDFSLAGDTWLYRLAKKQQDPEMEKIYGELRQKLQSARRIQQGTPEDGYAAMRLADYQEGRIMTLDEATPVIQRRLREDRASEKAKKEALDFAEKWKREDVQVKPEQLKDETCSAESRNPLMRELLGAPTALGEILPVGEGLDETPGAPPAPDSRRKRYLVGFAAERFLPAYELFERDSTFPRSMAEREIEDGRKLSLYEEGTNWLTTYRMIEESKEPDPPLFQERGRVPPPDTD